MIEFHESEYSESPLEENALRVLLSFLPRITYDKLLIGQVKYVRSNNRCRPSGVESSGEKLGERDDIDVISWSDICNSETKVYEEPVKEVHAVVV